MKQIVNPP